MRDSFLYLLCEQNNKREECYEHGVSPRTRNNSIQTMRSRRTSWRNGPTLRPCTRLPAHRSVHPLLTLLRKSKTPTIGQARRTRTKIGFYRALVKGNINVRVRRFPSNHDYKKQKLSTNSVPCKITSDVQMYCLLCTDANRKLKSFQQKLQSVRVDAPQDSAGSKITSPLCNKIKPEKPRIKEIQIHTPNKPMDSESFNKDGTIENHEAVVKSNPNNTVPFAETTCKVENVTSVHSELDIKDEGPIYESLPCNYGNYYYSTTSANYTMLNPNPTNYYITQPNVNPVDSQNTLIQSGPVVSSIIPPIQQNYYLPRGQNYFMQSPQSSFVPSPLFHPQGPQMISPQQFINYPHYAPYIVAPSQHQPESVHTGEQVVSRQMPPNPMMSGSPNAILLSRPSQNRYPIPRQSFPHPNGAVIRSSMPIRRNVPRISNVRSMKNVQQQRNTPVRTQTVKKSGTPSENNGQKTTSLIMLSDSDDEIEMIITEKCGPEDELEKTKATAESNVQQPRSKPTVTSDITVAPTKGTIPPQIIQRMNQGGISIIPIKPATLVQNSGTQLVVVVNETGSHYALALPNGSKLILTPEQVAQIRASNGGKLVL